jgi:hypothetical protein
VERSGIAMVAFHDKAKNEIWKTLKDLNNVWTKGNPDDLKDYFHADMVAITPTDKKRREGRDHASQTGLNFRRRQRFIVGRK